MDCIEAWIYVCFNSSATVIAEKELNDAFAMNESNWRVLEGKMILIDSEYLHEEIVQKQVDFMKSLSVNGAHEEFQTAVNEYQQGNFSHAINEAAKSVESTLKFVIKSDIEGDLTKLLKELRRSELVPNYYTSFFDSFFS